MTTQPLRPRRKPWRERRVRPPRPDIVVAGDTPPLAQLTIYPSLVLLSRRDAHGRARSHPISPDALGQVLGKVPTSSGLLPPNTLATGTINGTPYYVLWLPPVKRTLHTPDRDYTIPCPPLVWAGHGSDYRVWALGQSSYPQREQPLYDPPFPNSYRHGSICWGDVEARPQASPKTLLKVFGLFIESYFNLHVANNKSVAYPVSVLARWQQLVESKAKAYPLDDLMPAERSLGWLVGGGPWKDGRR